MKIALIGYGKMGKAIEEIALQRGHTIGLKIDIDSISQFTKENLSKCDVAIEFTSPHTALQNIITCLESGTPVVCGSTGWLEQWDVAKKKCEEKNGSLLYSSNYSIGVNIFFELNKKLASLMNQQTSYEISTEEIHHTQKKDAPSGTAITLAEQIMANVDRKHQWVNNESAKADDLTIISKRIDPAPGTHIVKYHSAIDDIEIIHTAHNRTGFATGAVLAAEFLKGKKGIYSMKDVLGL
ncbi:MAG TPA: 4-hydroxy-tetrahydrodipicolinate reductase [Ferruginibacter sp.]|jgi:4-hydroxy-tetrahydrodipicolinate reductase|nr:4-hydroxy-tetrahydrodipicolinate reductase [Ferruginibacter sp.]